MCICPTLLYPDCPSTTSACAGYDIVLPLLAATGTGPLVCEYASSLARERASTQRAAAERTIAAGEADASNLDANGGQRIELRLPDECAASDDVCDLATEAYVVVPDSCDVDNRVVCEPERPDERPPDPAASPRATNET